MSTILSNNELETFSSDQAQPLLSTHEVAATAYGLTTNNNSLSSTDSTAFKPLESEEHLNIDNIILNQQSAVTGLTESIVTSSFQPSEQTTQQPSTQRDSDELTGLTSSGASLLENSTQSRTTQYGQLSYSDAYNPTRSRRFKDDYTLSMNRGSSVTLNLESSSFDAYLQIVNARTGQVVRANDDGGRGTNSQISFTASADSQYIVRATSYSRYETGSYSLSAEFGQATQPTPTPNRFSSTYGYGRVDAAAAVAAAAGRSRFSNVRDIGGNQWNNDMVNAPEAWAQGYTGRGVTVAVIDSGVDIFHEDLRNNIWQNTDEILGDGIDNDGNGYVDDRYGWNFGVGENNNNVLPGNTNRGQDHGTHVAGTIASANNRIGTTGVAYGANIMAIRLGSVNNNRFTNGGDLATAIRYAVDNGADVINMSLGSNNSRVRSALAYAASRNVITVSAAGNSSLSQPGTPARYATDYGISVGSLTRSGGLSSFSNRAGSDSRMRHVMAGGSDVYSTLPGNRYGTKSGTSMAAPSVAGVVALMLSANRNLTHSQVRNILINSAIPIGGTRSASIANVSPAVGTQSIGAEPVIADYSNEQLPQQWQALGVDLSSTFTSPLAQLSDVDFGTVDIEAVEEIEEAVDNVERSVDRLLAVRPSMGYASNDSYHWRSQLQASYDDLLAPAIA